MKFKPWRNVKLGTGFKTGLEILKTLRSAGVNVSESAVDLLSNPWFHVVNRGVVAELVTVDLHNGQITYDNLLKNIIKTGFKPCLAEVGAQLRLQPDGRKIEGVLMIGAWPERIFRGSSGVLTLHTDDTGRCVLDAETLERHNRILRVKSTWVFMNPCS